MVWHSRTAYLLTWRHPYDAEQNGGFGDGCEGQGSLLLGWRQAHNMKGNGGAAAEFAERLSEGLSRNPGGRGLYERIRLYWNRNGGRAFPVVRDRSLPGVQGLY